jgi:carboxyl-terminal processing protease
MTIPETTLARSAFRLCPIVLVMALASCGGGGGGGSSSTPAATPPTPTPLIQPLSAVEARCAAPRPAGTVDPLSGQPYNDKQGTLDTEMSWIASYSNFTYLWYQDIKPVATAPYVIGATVPYIQPANNAAGTETVTTNYQVVDAYFNTQRSDAFTASGKPLDQFHFTYVTSVYDALETAGSVAGFGYTAAIISATPPRTVVVAYTEPNTIAVQDGLGRGAQFLTADGVDVVNGSDITTLNTALFSPVLGQTYTFSVLDQGATTPRTITMMAQQTIETPVQNVGVLPAPYGQVGYILFNEHIATAEAGLINAVTTLSQANGGQGITDLVLDMRYNGGGLLDIASELASMISSSATTSNATFEQESFNDKNPFDFTTAETTTPFWQESLGFSVPEGQTLPHLNLIRVFVLAGSGTCSASEAVINGLRGVGVEVILIGGTTCGKPYGFYPQDN